MLLRVLVLMFVMVANTQAMPDRDYQFRVLLNGDPIGSHVFDFTPEGSGYRLISTANYRVKVFFIPVYHYAHRSEELWLDGCLQRIESKTNDNDTQYQVTGNQQAEAFNVQVNSEPASHPGACISTFAYWQPGLLESDQLMNSQTGTMEEIGYSKLEPSRPPWEDSQQAETIQLDTEQGKIILWYREGLWLGLRTVLKNGHELVYQPVSQGLATDQTISAQ